MKTLKLSTYSQNSHCLPKTLSLGLKTTLIKYQRYWNYEPFINVIKILEKEFHSLNIVCVMYNVCLYYQTWTKDKRIEKMFKTSQIFCLYCDIVLKYLVWKSSHSFCMISSFNPFESSNCISTSIKVNSIKERPAWYF